MSDTKTTHPFTISMTRNTIMERYEVHFAASNFTTEREAKKFADAVNEWMLGFPGSSSQRLS